MEEKPSKRRPWRLDENTKAFAHSILQTQKCSGGEKYSLGLFWFSREAETSGWKVVSTQHFRTQKGFFSPSTYLA